MKFKTDYATEFVAQINQTESKYLLTKESIPINTIKQMIEISAKVFPTHTAFWQKFKGDSEYSQISYTRLLEDMNALGTALINHGMKNKRIAVIGENSYFWAISYLSAVCGTGIVVPLDKELSTTDIIGLIETSETSCVIFSPKYKKIFDEMEDSSKLLLVEMSGEYIKEGAETKEETTCGDKATSDDGVYKITDMLAEGKSLVESGDNKFTDAEIDTDAMSVLLFTSGTTGLAKGVMLSHRNICIDLMSAPNILTVYDTDLFFSVLPLHHTYECTCGFLMPLYKGAAIGYCEGLKYIQKNLKELNPTMLLAVPLILEKLYNSIWKNIRKQGKEKLVNSVLKAGRFLSFTGFNPADVLLKEIKAIFGRRLRVIIAGGAAINPDILEFFNDLGFLSVQGYGLTECAPMAALNPGKRSLARNTSVGHVLPQVEVKIIDADDSGIGEICLKGQNVMLGYYNNPEETAKAIIDGWFHTGDLGYVDDDDFIYITGRKKSVIIAPNGKNVFPEELEFILSENKLISEAFVWPIDDEYGQNKSIAATVKPDTEEVVALLGKDYTPEELAEAIHKEVDAINAKLPAFKKMNKIVIRTRDFDKTTSQKIKRFSEDNRS